MRVPGCLAAALFTVSCGPSFSAAVPPPPAIELAPCELPDVPGPVRCGVLHVPEDSLTPAGRAVPLCVAVLAATGAGEKLDDPLYFLSGGPGQAPSKQAEFVASIFREVRRSRDIVLVDLRGTGRSAPLDCDFHRGDPRLMLGETFPVAAVRACRDSLARRADLRLYSTGRAMRDLEQVRRALGHERINLYGTSYGTRAALEFARRYPSRVRSMILRGVTPPSLVVPLPFARDAQRSLDLLFAECERSAACREAHPDLPGALRSVLRALDQAPAPASVDTGGGARVRVAVHREAFTSMLRTLLSGPSVAARIPMLVTQAARGDYDPVAQTIYTLRSAAPGSVSYGFQLSVVCTEDLPRIRGAEVAAEVAGTFMGDQVVRQMRAACAEWPRGELPAEAGAPVHSGVPALLVSGAHDPATPPRWARDALTGLSRGRHVVAPAASHSADVTRPCADEVFAAFIHAGSAEAVDASCFERLDRPPFALPAAPER